MKVPTFLHLNKDWNAEPNAPDSKIDVFDSTVRLSFFLNCWGYDAAEEDIGQLAFFQCSTWRLGSTNDEGWHLGQCRYSKFAPEWGEFYELIGDDEVPDESKDWRIPPLIGAGKRHFLFYLKEDTFECFAEDWAFSNGTTQV